MCDELYGEISKDVTTSRYSIPRASRNQHGWRCSHPQIITTATTNMSLTVENRKELYGTAVYFYTDVKVCGCFRR